MLHSSVGSRQANTLQAGRNTPLCENVNMVMVFTVYRGIMASKVKDTLSF
jgi:hypothetical protein